MRRIARDVASTLLLAAAYVVVAKLGLRLASVTSSVTLVWPASGLSLAALLLLGRRHWPGVALGALLANASTPGVSLLVASGMAAGNTLEALIGAYLLQRSGFKGSMLRISDVVRLVAFGGIASTAASATIGVASLRLGGLIGGDALISTWRVWWLGDLMGDLVFAPLVLAFAAHSHTVSGPGKRAELAALLIALVTAALSAFGLLRWVDGVDFPQAYAVFPLLAWAALRFGSRGAAGANVIVSLISVAATVKGVGPFARGTLNESLFQLQTFMALAVLTSLFLGAAVAERDRAIALRDDFLTLATHELFTPITALQLDVASLTRMLSRETAPAEKIRHRAEHTGRQVDRLRVLVTRLLDSSQIAAGRLVLAPTSVDLAAVARDIRDRFLTDIEDNGGALELDAPAPVLGHWDRLRLEVVVSNLVSNAIKYGQNKPITITVVSSELEGILRIQDQGIGIARDQQRGIFERFERAVSSKSYPGFGLGLWIARAVVEAMGGRIDLTSEPSAGATFTVTLPRSST